MKMIKKAFIVLSIFILQETIFMSNVSAQEFTNNPVTESLSTIRRMWIDQHKVLLSPDTIKPPYKFYYRDGSWHGYLQLIDYKNMAGVPLAVYSGYVYPVDGPIPMQKVIIKTEAE